MASATVLVRPVGPTGGGARSADEITLTRPKTSIKKSFRLPSVPTSTTTADLQAEHVEPKLRAAVSRGESLFVFSAGPPASGKSTTLRGADGLMLLACDPLFDAAAALALEGEWMVCVSAVLSVITLATGQTAFKGSTPTRERLIDALLPPAVEQPKAGLHVRQIQADGLRHVTPHAVEGLSRPVVRSAAEARSMLTRAIERCALEEADPKVMAVHLLASLTLHRRAADGAESESLLCFVDLAGKSKPPPPTAAAAKGAAAKGAAAKSGVGEDPVLRAYHRCVDALEQVTVTYRYIPLHTVTYRYRCVDALEQVTRDARSARSACDARDARDARNARSARSACNGTPSTLTSSG